MPRSRWIVAVHEFWPRGDATTGPRRHVGFVAEKDARQYADALVRPEVGYVYPLTTPPVPPKPEATGQ